MKNTFIPCDVKINSTQTGREYGELVNIEYDDIWGPQYYVRTYDPYWGEEYFWLKAKELRKIK